MGMPWTVTFADEFEPEFDVLSEEVQDAILAKVVLLEREGPSYTLDTVRALQAARPGASWFLLIGADQYANLHSWHGWQELLTRVVLAVASRPGVATPPHPEVLAHTHRVVPLPPMDLSATELRTRIAAGQPITHLVPAAVASYIDQQALYRNAFRS